MNISKNLKNWINTGKKIKLLSDIFIPYDKCGLHSKYFPIMSTNYLRGSALFPLATHSFISNSDNFYCASGIEKSSMDAIKLNQFSSGFSFLEELPERTDKVDGVSMLKEAVVIEKLGSYAAFKIEKGFPTDLKFLCVNLEKFKGSRQEVNFLKENVRGVWMENRIGYTIHDISSSAYDSYQKIVMEAVKSNFLSAVSRLDPELSNKLNKLHTDDLRYLSCAACLSISSKFVYCASSCFSSGASKEDLYTYGLQFMQIYSGVSPESKRLMEELSHMPGILSSILRLKLKDVTDVIDKLGYNYLLK